MGLFESLKPKTVRERCETCGEKLVRNNDQQSLKYCSDFCRKLWHNRKAKS